jgi:2-amino-4-hydroxy-6-hydroxymethyldihydropteridine diphosphokinase
MENVKMAVLLLGVNLGHRERQLERAREHLAACGKITRQSAVYETAAWGLEDQPAFLNQVILLDTFLEPLALLDALQQIEHALGRERHDKWAARTMDIDVLFVDQLISKTDRLELPHPHLAHRRFTLVPLAEVLPEFVHPVLQKNITTLLAECTDALAVRKC